MISLLSFFIENDISEEGFWAKNKKLVLKIRGVLILKYFRNDTGSRVSVYIYFSVYCFFVSILSKFLYYYRDT